MTERDDELQHEERFPPAGKLAGELEECVSYEMLTPRQKGLFKDTLGLLEMQAAGRLAGSERVRSNLLEMISLFHVHADHGDYGKKFKTCIDNLAVIIGECAEAGISVEGFELSINERNQRSWKQRARQRKQPDKAADSQP